MMQDLSHNKLTVLPPGMGYLVRLVELNLSHNELTELPPDIVNLRGRSLCLLLLNWMMPVTIQIFEKPMGTL